jgi:tetratricopeptide (TPR) repeat protein
MGNAQLGLSNFNIAREQFEFALRVNSNNANAQLGLAKVALGQSNLSEARDLLLPIADRNTTELGAESQYLLGILSKMEENSTVALEEFARVKVLFEAFDEWVSASLLEAAQIHLSLGNTGEASGMLNEIVERYPDTPAGPAARTLIEQQNL